MAAALEGGDGTAIGQAAETLYDAAMALRAERIRYARHLRQMGPTPFADANRVLFHLRLVLEGQGESRFALEALRGLATMHGRTLADLAAREQRCIFNEARPEAEYAAQQIARLAQAGESLLTDESRAPAERQRLLGGLVEQLLSTCQLLAESLGRYAAAEAASGPTLNANANTVVQAIRHAEAGRIDLSELAELVADVQETLAEDDPLSPLLAGLQDACAATAYEAVSDAVSYIERTGRTAAMSDDDEQVFDVIHDDEGLVLPGGPAIQVVPLPANLRIALEAVGAYIRQPEPAASDAAWRLVNGLTQKVDATFAVVDKMPDEVQTSMTAGLHLLRLGVQALLSAWDHHSREHLESAREAFEQGTEILRLVSDLRGGG